MSEVLDFGCCPRCGRNKEWRDRLGTKVIDGVTFCTLCAEDLERRPQEKTHWVNLAKDYKNNEWITKPEGDT